MSTEPDDPDTKVALVRLLADGAERGIDWYAPKDGRFADLVARLTVTDGPWILRCIAWMRAHQTLAPAAIVATAEVVRARLRKGEAGSGTNRKLVAFVLHRADEPGAMLGYCLARHGPLPKPIQRGIADAAKKLYTEESAAEFDVPGRGPRFGDVLSTTHARPGTDRQSVLFRRLLERRGAVTRPVPSPPPPADPELVTLLADAARTGRFPF